MFNNVSAFRLILTFFNTEKSFANSDENKSTLMGINNNLMSFIAGGKLNGQMGQFMKANLKMVIFKGTFLFIPWSSLVV